MKDFVYSYLPYLLVLALALALLLTDQEVGLNLHRTAQPLNGGIIVGLYNQRMLSLLAIAVCLFCMLRKARHNSRRR